MNSKEFTELSNRLTRIEKELRELKRTVQASVSMQSGIDFEKYLTYEQATAILKIDRTTLYRWVQRGEIKPVSSGKGRRVLFRRDEIEKLLNN